MSVYFGGQYLATLAVPAPNCFSADGWLRARLAEFEYDPINTPALPFLRHLLRAGAIVVAEHFAETSFDHLWWKGEVPKHLAGAWKTEAEAYSSRRIQWQEKSSSLAASFFTEPTTPKDSIPISP